MSSKNRIKLGINIDHIATLRNARNGLYPNVFEADKIVRKIGNFTTIHLRSDRRHIKDSDVIEICNIKNKNNFFVNFELGMSDDIVNICLNTKPHAACIVPEKREELTTENGLDLANKDVMSNLQKYVPLLKSNNIRVSFFVDANEQSLNILKSINNQIKPNACEIHTGKFCDLVEDYIYKSIDKNFNYLNFNYLGINFLFKLRLNLFVKKHFYFIFTKNISTKNIFTTRPQKNYTKEQNEIKMEYEKISNFAKDIDNIGIEVHAGHGLTFASLCIIKNIKQIREVSIGHFVISQSVVEGFTNVVKKMKCILK